MNGNQKVEPHRSSLGMDANVMALITYLAAFVLSWIPVIQYVAWLAPLIIFFIEKQSAFVRFHAMQALLLEAVSWVFAVIFGIITASMLLNPYSWGAIGAISTISIIISIALTVVAILTLVKAYGYVEFRLPVIGNLAANIAYKRNVPPMQ